MPKRIINPQARWTPKPAVCPVHRQRTFAARGGEDQELEFEIYRRQHLRDRTHFSAGILVRLPDGSGLTLARYNGSSHEHGEISWREHIHRATERAIREDRKPEYYADATDRYWTAEGALACLLDDFSIVTKRLAKHDQRRLL